MTGFVTIGLAVVPNGVTGNVGGTFFDENGIVIFGVYLHVTGTGFVPITPPPVVYIGPTVVVATFPCPPVVVFTPITPEDVAGFDPVGTDAGIVCAVTTATVLVGAITPGVDVWAPFLVDGHVKGEVNWPAVRGV